MSINWSADECDTQVMEDMFENPEQRSILIEYMEHCGIRQIRGEADAVQLTRRIEVMNWMFGFGLYLDDPETRKRWTDMLQRVTGFKVCTPHLQKDEFLAKWRKRLKEECDRIREMNKDE